MFFEIPEFLCYLILAAPSCIGSIIGSLTGLTFKEAEHGTKVVGRNGW
jgi:hypothetical protein